MNLHYNTYTRAGFAQLDDRPTFALPQSDTEHLVKISHLVFEHAATLQSFLRMKRCTLREPCGLLLGCAEPALLGTAHLLGTSLVPIRVCSLLL